MSKKKNQEHLAILFESHFSDFVLHPHQSCCNDAQYGKGHKTGVTVTEKGFIRSRLTKRRRGKAATELPQKQTRIFKALDYLQTYQTKNESHTHTIYFAPTDTSRRQALLKRDEIKRPAQQKRNSSKQVSLKIQAPHKTPNKDGPKKNTTASSLETQTTRRVFYGAPE